MDKQKIFVVDDKDMIGKIIMACLGRDYDCRYFDSPKPVLEQMEAGDLPDLIISDIPMLYTLRSASRSPTTPRCSIIIPRKHQLTFLYPYARHAGR